MKTNILYAFIIVALLFSSMYSEAQISLEFEKLDVKNINSWTNRLTTPEIMQYGDMFLSGISIEVTAKLNNMSDEALYFEEGDNGDNVKLAVCYYEIGSGWKKMYLYQPGSTDLNILSGIDLLNSGESVIMRTGAVFPASLFQKEPPLYYMSSIVPSMYLVFEMAGHEPIYSDLTKTIFLNGRKLKPEKTDCHTCGEIYLLTHNIGTMEYLMAMEGPNGGRLDLNSMFYSDYLLGKAFVCNMDFTSRQLPIAKHP